MWSLLLVRQDTVNSARLSGPLSTVSFVRCPPSCLSCARRLLCLGMMLSWSATRPIAGTEFFSAQSVLLQPAAEGFPSAGGSILRRPPRHVLMPCVTLPTSMWSLFVSSPVPFPSYVLASGFDEIDRDLLSRCDWRLIMHGSWSRHENILLTEARALLPGIRHKLRSAKACAKRHTFLVDNLPLALTASKGRPGSPNLVPVLRSIAAHSLASGARFAVRWLPGELNPADAASRGEEILGDDSELAGHSRHEGHGRDAHLCAMDGEAALAAAATLMRSARTPRCSTPTRS